MLITSGGVAQTETHTLNTQSTDPPHTEQKQIHSCEVAQTLTDALTPPITQIALHTPALECTQIHTHPHKK